MKGAHIYTTHPCEITPEERNAYNVKRIYELVFKYNYEVLNFIYVPWWHLWNTRRSHYVVKLWDGLNLPRAYYFKKEVKK